MDVIYSIVAVVFAWLCLGAVLLFPLWVVEVAINKYVNYATENEVNTPTPLDAYTHKTGAPEWVVPIIGLGIIYLVIGTILVLISTYVGNEWELSEGISYIFFEVFWIVGNWAAPVLLVAGVVACVTMLSKTIFRLKKKLTAHIKDKEIHNG